MSRMAAPAGLNAGRRPIWTAAVNDIVKKLQGVAPETETVADKAATATTVDNAASDAVAAASELTHATSNKMVTVSVPSPAASGTDEVAKTAPADQTSPKGEVTGTDEKAGAPTESADDAGADATKPKSQSRVKAPTLRTGTSPGTQRKLVKDVNDAVKNVRNRIGGPNTRKSTESSTASSGSSAGAASSGASSSAGGSSHSSAKPAQKDKNKD